MVVAKRSTRQRDLQNADERARLEEKRRRQKLLEWLQRRAEDPVDEEEARAWDQVKIWLDEDRGNGRKLFPVE